MGGGLSSHGGVHTHCYIQISLLHQPAKSASKIKKKSQCILAKAPNGGAVRLTVGRHGPAWGHTGATTRHASDTRRRCSPRPANGFNLSRRRSRTPENDAIDAATVRGSRDGRAVIGTHDTNGAGKQHAAHAPPPRNACPRPSPRTARAQDRTQTRAGSSTSTAAPHRLAASSDVLCPAMRPRHTPSPALACLYNAAPLACPPPCTCHPRQSHGWTRTRATRTTWRAPGPSGSGKQHPRGEVRWPSVASLPGPCQGARRADPRAGLHAHSHPPAPPVPT